MKKLFAFFTKTFRNNIITVVILFFVFWLSVFSSSFLVSFTKDYSLDALSARVSGFPNERYPQANDLEPLISLFSQGTLKSEKRRQFLQTLKESGVVKSALAVSDDFSSLSYKGFDIDVSKSNVLSFYDYEGYQENREPKLWKINGFDLYTLFVPNLYKGASFDFAYISQTLANLIIEQHPGTNYASLLSTKINVTLDGKSREMVINNIVVDDVIDAEGTSINSYGNFLKKQYGDYFILTYSLSNFWNEDEAISNHFETIPYCSMYSTKKIFSTSDSCFGNVMRYEIFKKSSIEGAYSSFSGADQLLSNYINNRANTPLLLTIASLLILINLVVFLLLFKKRPNVLFVILVFCIFAMAIYGIISTFFFFYYVWGIFYCLYAAALIAFLPLTIKRYFHEQH